MRVHRKGPPHGHLPRPEPDQPPDGDQLPDSRRHPDQPHQRPCHRRRTDDPRGRPRPAPGWRPQLRRRLSRPLQPLARRLRRPAGGDRRARATARGAWRSTSVAGSSCRRSPRPWPAPGTVLARRPGPGAGPRPSIRRGVHRRGAQPPAHRVHRPARDHRRCSPARTTRTSACTARTAMTWRSSSSRCGSATTGRSPPHRDLVLHLADEILVVDRKRETCVRHTYDFTVDHDAAAGRVSTAGLDRAHPTNARRVRDGRCHPRRWPALRRRRPRAPRNGSPAATCSRSSPGHVMSTAPCDSPAGFYERLRTGNPAPYEFFFNLGEGEYLVGASPEMYVRVTGDRVETCPIAGTIRRGADALEDADQIRELAQLRQGRVGADDVHRRRPQRQGAGLRTRQRQGDRPPADRDVLPADPHRRPHRGPAAAGARRVRRVPHPHVGGDGDRRAQAVGDAVHRGPRGRRRGGGTAARSGSSASTGR